MTVLSASRYLTRSPFLVIVFLILLATNGSAGAVHPPKSETPTALLVEARAAATSIDDAAERSAALNSIVVAQIAIDPPAAPETLKIVPKLPKKIYYFTPLAAAYAEAGNI